MGRFCCNKTGPTPLSDASHSTTNDLKKIWKGQDRSRGHGFLQMLKGFSGFFIPCERIFLQQGSRWCCYSAIIGSEFSIITCEFKEALVVSDSRRSGLRSHGGDFGWICNDSLCWNNMAQICNLGLSRGAFGFLRVEMMVGQQGEE